MLHSAQVNCVSCSPVLINIHTVCQWVSWPCLPCKTGQVLRREERKTALHRPHTHSPLLILPVYFNLSVSVFMCDCWGLDQGFWLVAVLKICFIGAAALSPWSAQRLLGDPDGSVCNIEKGLARQDWDRGPRIIVYGGLLEHTSAVGLLMAQVFHH